MAPFIVALLVCLGAPTLIAQCALEIGKIADLKGTWEDSKYKRAIIKNDVVCANSQIQRVKDDKASAADFLKLTVRSDPKQTVVFECRALFGCESPLDLGSLANEEQRKLKGSGILESYGSWLNSRDRRTTTMSRVGQPPGTPVLRTTVVEAGKVLPAIDVFRPEAPIGKYQLDLCAQSTDDACGKTSPTPVEFSWQHVPANLPFAAPSAGIHLLYRLKDDDVELRTTDRVLIIAVDPARANLVAEARDKLAIAELTVSRADAAQVADFEGYVRDIGVRLTTH